MKQLPPFYCSTKLFRRLLEKTAYLKKWMNNDSVMIDNLCHKDECTMKSWLRTHACDMQIFGMEIAPKHAIRGKGSRHDSCRVGGGVYRWNFRTSLLRIIERKQKWMGRESHVVNELQYFVFVYVSRSFSAGWLSSSVILSVSIWISCWNS